MAVIRRTETNNLDEVVAVVARKGNGVEVRRHITDIVLLMRNNEVEDSDENSRKPKEVSKSDTRISRGSKTACIKKNKSLMDQGLV